MMKQVMTPYLELGNSQQLQIVSREIGIGSRFGVEKQSTAPDMELRNREWLRIDMGII